MKTQGEVETLPPDPPPAEILAGHLSHIPIGSKYRIASAIACLGQFTKHDIGSCAQSDLHKACRLTAGAVVRRKTLRQHLLGR